MNMFGLNKILRFLILSWSYKISFFSYFLRCICYLPFFKYEVIRINNENRDEITSKGHIEPGKRIEVKIFNITIIKLVLQKGENLTAEHFYFHRPLKDIKFFLRNCKNYINFNKETFIFDPGCGTGKHLMYITDKYRCKGIGIDIYPKAINVSKKIEKFSNCKFLLGNSCDKNILTTLSKYNNYNKIDILFINSWVNHVYKNKEFSVFLNFIRKIKCRVMIIETKKIDLKRIFKTNKILYQKFKNNSQYVILEL